MKQKKTIDVPDSIFEALGFALPQNTQAEYEKGNSITDYVGESRVVSLRKEHTYHKAYPILNGIGLLNLNFPNMPMEECERADYVLQIIRRYIKNTPTSLQKKNETVSGSGHKADDLTFINSILKPFQDEVQVSIAKRSLDPTAEVACEIFRLPSCYRISLNCMDGEIVYGAVGTRRKRKDGYYYLGYDCSHIAHITDLVQFLSVAFLLAGIHQIRTTVELPLIQDVFEKYLAEESSKEREDIYRILEQSIDQKFPVSLKNLFFVYNSRGKKCFCLKESPYLIADTVRLLCSILEIYHEISYENRHRQEIGRSIATAYITKKNIPQSIQGAMERTAFMDYFKFVEFDEDVDLASVRTIEKEFEVLNRAYFMGKIFKNVTLRFRKLGKHKASGLYYPTLHTLCVDIRSPSSFIHEYFHMIDDQLGDLSLEVSFNPITVLYKESFLRQMEQLSDAVKSTLNGKSKYNIQYFFRRAEIFARCGEIYFSRILKVESSLIKPDLAYAYPESEALDEAVKTYFEMLLTVRLPNYGLPEAV